MKRYTIGLAGDVREHPCGKWIKHEDNAAAMEQCRRERDETRRELTSTLASVCGQVNRYREALEQAQARIKELEHKLSVQNINQRDYDDAVDRYESAEAERDEAKARIAELEKFVTNEDEQSGAELDSIKAERDRMRVALEEILEYNEGPYGSADGELVRIARKATKTG
jgi:DNA repair exonuclease SbcCD ATPase subunit